MLNSAMFYAGPSLLKNETFVNHPSQKLLTFWHFWPNVQCATCVLDSPAYNPKS